VGKALIVCECPGCLQERKMTRHHIYPRRHFGTRRNTELFLLCRECHDELEHKFIPDELMPREFYPTIVQVFLHIKARNRKLVEVTEENRHAK